MQLVTFAGQDGAAQLGVLRDGAVRAIPGMRDVQDAIDSGVGDLGSRAETQGRPLSDLKVLAPIVRPRRNVFCVGLNYAAHIEEGRVHRGLAAEPAPKAEYPTFFTKVPEGVIGQGEGIPLYQSVSDKLDWEAELAVVIGTPGRGIPEKEALSHVYGYTCANDISVRDVQRRHGNQWFKGKSMDRHCPLGPCLITADELGDPQVLEIMCRVNGVEKQHSNTELMIFNVRRIIAELSVGLQLLPGDVILTGTPNGVGFARTPPEFLKVGDIVEVEIQGLGILRNHIIAA